MAVVVAHDLDQGVEGPRGDHDEVDLRDRGDRVGDRHQVALDVKPDGRHQPEPERRRVGYCDHSRLAEATGKNLRGARDVTPRRFESDGTIRPDGAAGELHRVRAAQVGARNHRLNRSAFAVAQLIAGGNCWRALHERVSCRPRSLSDWTSPSRARRSTAPSARGCASLAARRTPWGRC
jgi:hypothetical protein